jgi:hypothetical protein
VAKNPKTILEHVLKLRKTSKNVFACLKIQSIALILQPVYRILKDLGLYFKNIKNLFLAKKYIINF